MLEIDRFWVGEFLDQLQSLWREHAATPSGLFDPYLDRHWRHDTDGPRTLVSQCRLIYNFARSFERSGEPAYEELARYGIAALVRSFKDPGEAGWAWSCRSDASIEDSTYDAYGHAFVVLALATAAAVFQDTGYRDLALQTWEFMQRRFRDRHGGLIWHIRRDGSVPDDVRSQNPLMHTFEALLVLAPLSSSGATRRDAEQIWRFLQARMLRPGCLPEWYDTDWQPVAASARAIVDTGHAFEWAFLLSEAQKLFPDDHLLDVGRQFLAFGMRHGYDTETGGIVSPVDFEGRPRDRRKGWWEQCEAIRAMHRYAARHEMAEIATPLRQSIDYVRALYVDDEFGGWYEGPFGTEQEPSRSKGNAWKLDYHVVNMCRELLAG